MKTVYDVKMACDPDLFVGMLSRDAGLAARRKAKTEAYRMACKTQTERELEAVKAQHARNLEAKDKQHQRERETWQEKATQALLDHDVAAGILVTGALVIGYLWAFV